MRRSAEFAMLKMRRGCVQCPESVKHNEIKPTPPALKYWESQKSKLPQNAELISSAGIPAFRCVTLRHCDVLCNASL